MNRRRLPVVVLCILFIGCRRGSELRRVAVAGKVSYQGEPIADGVIVFVPVQGTAGPGASAVIKDGGYNVLAGGGVPIGIYRVEVQAFRASSRPGPALGPLRAEPVTEPYLPSNFNTESTLELHVSGQPLKHADFDLK